MLNADYLTAIMESSFDEIYIIDCKTLRIIDLNASALNNLGYTRQAVLLMTLPALAGAAYGNLLQQPDNASPPIRLELNHIRADGSTYPLEVRLLRTATAVATTTATPAPEPAYIVIGHDLSQREAVARTLLMLEERFRAIVSNTPGLVYQFLLQADGSIAFPYLSDGCHALLGVLPEHLQADAKLLQTLIMAEDQPSYLASMLASAADKTSWNWEGRIWIEEWKDIKWINLRATPRALPGDTVQWEGIMTNITQSKLEEAEIKRAGAQLSELSAHVETVKEQERTRIAREIHDDLGGNLTAIKMSLALLARRLPPEAQLVEKATYLDSLVDRTIESVHRISGDLRPSVLDFGLVAAIDWQATEFEKQSGIPCVFVTNRKEVNLDPDQATALFRIFQEALTNISKHAQATRVQIDLVRGTRNVRLQISDNGRGIESDDRFKPKSFGIRGMAERASALGGGLTITNGADGGSVVSVKVPLTHATQRPTRTGQPAGVNRVTETRPAEMQTEFSWKPQ